MVEPATSREADRPAWTLTRWLFLRLLAATYLIAFVSLWVQVHGLVGSRGILPVAEHLEGARAALGPRAYLELPTLCWLGPGDGLLTVLCGLGVAGSVLLLIGVAPAPMLIVLWASYLSLVVAGQIFLSFQWDVLLLETGFVAIFVAPWRLRPALGAGAPPPAGGIWLLRALLFKLMFLSGATKLLSGDPTWRDLSALDVHYQTQPLPTWFGWYVHQMPSWSHRASVVAMFVAELGVPLLIFAPRRLRLLAAAAMALLQLAIAAAGNYGFFNLLTLVLCVTCLDDRALRALLPRRLRGRIAEAPLMALAVPRPPWRRGPGRLAVAALLSVSALTFVREMVRTARDPGTLPAPVNAVVRGLDRAILSWAQPGVLRWTDPFRTVSGYGLFRVMTTQRPEILLEVSADGVSWHEWPFRWKPGDPARPPGFVQPHMPRLDWQMWFAALAPSRHAWWLSRLAERLRAGSPEVLDLLGECPIPGGSPPRHVRFVLYRYEFTDPATRAATGAWWSREPVGPRR